MAKTEEIERAQWGSRIGFILAAMGSAVGFGSIARFPMNVANNGGAVFVLIYAIIMLFVGVPLMLAEFGLGRESQRNTVGTFKDQTKNPKTKWRITGVYWFLVPAFFLSWYAVVSGWMLKLAFASLTGAYFDDPGSYIARSTEGPSALLWAFIVLALTGSVVVFGVAKGIERLNLVLMPTLFLMIIGLTIYAATLPNNGPGYTFYMQPDFGAVNLGVITAAVGQAFFSLSLAMGALLVYASYLSKKASLAENALIISGSTLMFAVVCGFMIFPMLSSFGLLDAAQGTAGLGLILGPLTNAFVTMGGLGMFVGFIFFLATFFASFTSAVSLTEPAIAYLVEERGITRARATTLVVLAIYIAGIMAAFSLSTLDLLGGALTDVQVILGGLLLAIFVGYRLPKPVARAQMDEAEKGLRLSWFAYPVVKYAMPIVLSVLLFFTLAGTPCAFTGVDADGNPNPSTGLVEGLANVAILGCNFTPAAVTSPAFGFIEGVAVGAAILAILFGIAWLVLLIVIAIWLHRDATKRGESAGLWTLCFVLGWLFGVILGIVVLLAYAARRGPEIPGATASPPPAKPTPAATTRRPRRS
jgi:neurotransmitter:Na+ symporter, NSS family